MVRVDARVLGAALCSALGLSSFACGGISQGQHEQAGGSGSGVGGSGVGGSGVVVGGGGMVVGGSGGSVGVVGGSAGAGGAPVSRFPCLSPMSLPGGFEQCAGGLLHRPRAEACKSQLPRPGSNNLPVGVGDCHADTDCVAMPNGICVVQADASGSYCNYGCVTDADCQHGVCECGEAIGFCRDAACTSDAECGPGLRCQSYQSSPCDGGTFVCETATDTCATNSDCVPTEICQAGVQASSTPQGHACMPMNCAAGRPFLVAGQARVAALAADSSWASAPELTQLARLSAEQRSLAAQHWLEVARLEHASIAAFARFALQLLQLGAPPELVESATAAIADETRHARLAFGIAGQLAASAVGPGVLDVHGSLLETALVDVARLVVREGCVGETGAALEAREAALAATEPALAQLLHDIADDESRHAELAWRFVAWALERDPLRVAAVLHEELEREQARLATQLAPPASADELAGSGVGVVPAVLRLELQKAALRDVVQPCAQALLARVAAAQPASAGLSA